MTTAIGVLCARVRVEEKQIITALGDAGAVAMPVPPSGTPLPPCPAPQDIVALGSGSFAGDVDMPVLIDRGGNRAVSAPLIRMVQCAGIGIIGGGLAAHGTRLDVANAIGNAGLPRPETLVAFSEASGVEAAAKVGFPATLLPIESGSAATSLLDVDTADAVIEHRVVLGTKAEAVVLIQAGAPKTSELSRVHVVDGRAVAVDGATPSTDAIDLAEQASRAIGATLVAVDIATVNGRSVVWDVVPVADFRASTPLGRVSIGEAVADLAMRRAEDSGRWEGACHVIALTA
ncbi:MAG TPA: hypothetical protein VNZ55_07800 [Thermomicrobiales bacterium]|nr:hypothetical protein [Thermomicrobiales bacterium]